MCDIRSGVANISVHLAHDTDMLVAVEKRVLVFALHTRATDAAVGCLVCLETGIGQDDNQPLTVLVTGGNGHMLFGD